jgi:formate-dependent nitrite reductase membrane component NrfD
MQQGGSSRCGKRRIHTIHKERMTMKTAGIILLIAGLLMTLYTGFTYFTKKKIMDLKNIHITANKKHSVN